MDEEQLKIFDENRNHIGVATRRDVHRIGHWHEAFHCWFISNEEGIDYIYLQLRSENKKDYPNLLDITAAGHLLADETIKDGVREIKEEIGIDVPFEELVPLGVINYCVYKEGFIDKEFANVFVYMSDYTFDDFTFQAEEVSGIVKVRFNDFTELWTGAKDTIELRGLVTNEKGDKTLIKDVGKDKFVPHPTSFYKTVIQKLKTQIK